MKESSDISILINCHVDYIDMLLIIMKRNIATIYIYIHTYIHTRARARARVRAWVCVNRLFWQYWDMPMLLHTLEYIDSMTYTFPIFFRYDILINMYIQLIIDWLFWWQYKIIYMTMSLALHPPQSGAYAPNSRFARSPPRYHAWNTWSSLGKRHLPPMYAPTSYPPWGYK